MKPLDKEILRLAIPSILANITVPLVGMVDTAIAGHLHGSGGSAAFIGGISIGALMLNLLYWNFFFLRASTGGLTAQAFGRKALNSTGEPSSECAAILARGLSITLIMAVLILALQWPYSRLALLVVDGSPTAIELALKYFFIRIWAAPATLSLMVFRGWFVGMQDSKSSMWVDLIVNVGNIVFSLILSLGIGGWSGMGFTGIPTGTVIAQYCGMLYSIVRCGSKYRSEFQGFRLRESFSKDSLRSFVTLNADLFVRSLSFTGIYMGFTMIAAHYGDLMLACASIMMNLLMIFSYFTDGFAYAGQALTGRFIGERQAMMVRFSVHRVFVWSMAVAIVWVGIYALAGTPLLNIMTDDSSVRQACSAFLPWLIIMPPLGCAAFTWDGIYIGATASKDIRNAMLGALASFLAIWFIGKSLLANVAGIKVEGTTAIHLLLAAYFAHIIFRTIYLSIRYRHIARNFPSSRSELPQTESQ